MGYTYSFLDNQQIAGTGLNAVTTDMPGITDVTGFVDGVTYGVDALNDITKNLINKGVAQGDGAECRVTVSGSSVKILSGLAFFGSGAKIRIDAEGVTLSMAPNVKNYVWLQHSKEANSIMPRCTTTAPAGEFVELAEVTGTDIFDRRQYAVMKNPSLLPNLIASHTIAITFGYPTASAFVDTGIDITGCKYVAANTKGKSGSYDAGGFGWWDIVNDKYISTRYNWANTAAGRFDVSFSVLYCHHNGYIFCKAQNNTLWISGQGVQSGHTSQITLTFC